MVNNYGIIKIIVGMIFLFLGIGLFVDMLFFFYGVLFSGIGFIINGGMDIYFVKE